MRLFDQFKKKPTFLKTHNLPNPKSYTGEVLLKLMETGHVSLKDFPYLASFRSIISDLKLQHKLTLTFTEQEFHSKYGNKGVFRTHHLQNEEMEKAVSLYRYLNA